MKVEAWIALRMHVISLSERLVLSEGIAGLGASPFVLVVENRSDGRASRITRQLRLSWRSKRYQLPSE